MPLTYKEAYALATKTTWYKQQAPGNNIYISMAAGSGFYMKQQLGFGYHYFFFNYKDGIVQIYYDQNDLTKINKILLEKCTNDNNYFKKMRKRAEQDYHNSKKKYYKKLTTIKLLQKASEKELLELLALGNDLVQKSVGIGHMIEPYVIMNEKVMIDAFTKLITQSSLRNTVMMQMTSPFEKSFSLKYQEALEKVYVLRGKKKELAITTLIKDFFWIKASYSGGNRLNPEAVLQELASLRKEKIEKKNNTNKQLKNKVKELSFITLAKKFGISKNIQAICKNMKLLTSWQDDRKQQIFESITLFDDILIAYAATKKISLENLRLMNINEILSGTLQDISILKSRKTGCTELFARDCTISSFINSENTQLFDAIQMHHDSNQITLSGMCASPGTVIGEAMICISHADIVNFPQGKILVTSMTRPEFLPAMKRASAIITDEGGITCHAAIVSRELGIPCIIGTKNATKILKSNDLVEVKANHGQVIILKSSQIDDSKVDVLTKNKTISAGQSLKKLVIFDMSDVCFYSHEHNYIEQLLLEKKFSVDNKKAAHAYYDELLAESEINKITGIQVLENFFKKYSIPKDPIKELAIMLSQNKMDDLVFALISQLKKEYKVAFITNYNQDYWGFLDKKFKISSFFDYGVVSYQIGYRKPALEGFQNILNNCKVNPEETVYIDDNTQNLIPAKKLGMSTIQFVSYIDTITCLKREGIKIPK